MSVNPRNLVEWLAVHEPSTLESLRSSHPSAAPLLRRDRKLGSEEKGMPAEEAMAGLVAAGLDLGRKRVDTLIAQLTQRIARANRLKTYASVTSAVASAGLVASLAKVFAWSAGELQLSLAVVTLGGSLLTIFAEQAAGGANGGRIRQAFADVVAASQALLKVDQAWQRQRLAGLNVKALDKILVELDSLALQLHDIELLLKVT